MQRPEIGSCPTILNTKPVHTYLDLYLAWLVHLFIQSPNFCHVAYCEEVHSWKGSSRATIGRTVSNRSNRPLLRGHLLISWFNLGTGGNGRKLLFSPLHLHHQCGERGSRQVCRVYQPRYLGESSKVMVGSGGLFSTTRGEVGFPGNITPTHMLVLASLPAADNWAGCSKD